MIYYLKSIFTYMKHCQKNTRKMFFNQKT